MVLGLPGVGKSYFARQFARSIGGIHINSDIIRKQIIRQPTYTKDEKSRVYSEMFDTVTRHLRSGNTVVVDATFSKKEHRLPYYNYVDQQKIELKLIKIDAIENVVKERLKVHRPDSDADYEVYQKIKREYDPVDRPHLVLDSSKLDIDQMIVKATAYISFISPK